MGDFLKGLLSLGNTRDWRKVMREYAGGEISAKPMVDYYAPLVEWLEAQNEGRAHTLQESPSPSSS